MASKEVSAGLLMYHRREGEVEVLLVHPGGPFWAKKDAGVWSLPKGLAEDGEQDLLDVAKREFEEETGVKPQGNFEYVGRAVRNDGKIVEAWCFEGDCDPSSIVSNTFMLEWPPHSGKKIEIPEVDRGDFFTIAEAREKLNPYQLPILEAFEGRINTGA